MIFKKDVLQGRNYADPNRRRECIDLTYGGRGVNFRSFLGKAYEDWPTDNPYHIYWGEIHGHTELSDGEGSLDDYFQAARGLANLDFCAVTDHDHGGLGKQELFGDKWEHTQAKVEEYHDPGRFVTLLGYERDSWPFYSNLCVYYRYGRGEMIRGVRDGEITREELEKLLGREDVLAIPHHTADIGQGVNFDALPLGLMPTLTEIYSKWGTSECFGNPRPVAREGRGGHWRDALEAGALVGCVAGSDIHSPYPGMPVEGTSKASLRYREPGLVAVLAKELTREAVFDALKARRCYAASGARIVVDFRINGEVMGRSICVPKGTERMVHVFVEAESPIERLDVIKNSRNYFSYHIEGRKDSEKVRVVDLKSERDTDYYYVRVTQSDGRCAWSSPIWITEV